MNKVFIVERCENEEGCHIKGVFKNKEDAEKCAKQVYFTIGFIPGLDYIEINEYDVQ